MPEDSKKNQQTGKNDPKEQRKPRRTGHKEAHAEKKKHKETEEQRAAPKVIVSQKPPVYESPGPEFYQNLKRETDEILKITEEENAKYKKKEIQSNWSKYEMPIESYDDMEEQENLGADYEKLIQAPLSVGGHFQFKHEKSWDITTGPSLYDKYFDINMDNLSLALSTIPFYERNVIDQSVFTQTDIQTMTNRSTRFKQKYYNDKSYTTPELDAQEKILNNLKENLSKPQDSQEITSDNDDDGPIDDNQAHNKDIDLNTEVDEKEAVVEERSETQETKLEFKSIPKTEAPNPVKIKEVIMNTDVMISKSMKNKLFDLDDIILEKEDKPIKEIKIKSVALSEASPKVLSSPVDNLKKEPVIESPEDLEKWLDDFLDG